MTNTVQITFSDIVSKLEGYAKVAVQAVETTGEKIITDVEDVVEAALPAAMTQLGQFAVQTVTNLFGAAGAGLSGSEKKGLAVTTVLQQAETQGVTLLDDIASALVENSFTAVVSVLSGI